ncbi:MMPL family transporter [Iamia sp. SCSIO 61187]|uniref:MMPL family transporter n=1 Tax=Iamia sp. SCSIO 61187 TaxID=2722752 RepID=UPI001C62568C|nr:MMPL family transporter [Iamia sp. SCSIO 61187]QYG91536.1 MMPL family transporter [Iamia sp. SCSIO 61187]
MLTRLAHLTVRRRVLVLVLATVGFALAGAVGGGVAEHLSSGGFDDPASESSRAEDALADTFGTGAPNVLLLVTADDGTDVDAPALAASAEALVAELEAQPDIDEVASYWTLGRPPPLRSAEGDSAIVVARIEGDQSHVVERGKELREELSGPIDGGTVAMGGAAGTFADINHTIEEDLVRAELIALPITIILLLLIFRGVVASLLPLAMGALSIVGTFLVLRGLAGVTEVSIFALNLTTAMGLGLAIDYSLFMVSRYREELAAGYEPPVAVVRTVRTAGRTVAFSALTVAASLCALLVFPQAFLRSFAYAGVAVAALAGLAAVVVLPAVLAVLGHRVDALALRRREPKPVGEGVWHRVATLVMRRPLPVITVVVLVLLALGSPFRHIELGRPDDRVLPASAESRQVNDILREEYSSNEAGALSVVAADTSPAGTGAERDEAIAAYAAGLSQLDGVARVDAATGVYIDGAAVPVGPELTARFAGDDATWMSVVPSVEPVSPEGEALVEEIRSTDAPFEVLVAGEPAALVDGKDSMFSRLPLALAIIAGITFVLLFLMFGSVLVPLKALVLNLLSLTATFGAMVWIFQDGNLSGFLDFTSTGSIDSTMPILMFCIAFGLSMDYEVFLLSRIKEEHDAGHDNVSSVARGLERTGRIVTAAALLISVVFLAFATSHVSFIKLFGIGLTLAVLMDAFVIRGTLVPAFMRLAGEANWWAPRWMRWIHARVGISETVDLDDDDRDDPPPGPSVGPTDGPSREEPVPVGA